MPPHMGSSHVVLESPSGISFSCRCLYPYQGRTGTARAKHDTFAACLRHGFVGQISLLTFIKINEFLPRVRGIEVIK